MNVGGSCSDLLLRWVHSSALLPVPVGLDEPVGSGPTSELLLDARTVDAEVHCLQHEPAQGLRIRRSDAENALDAVGGITSQEHAPASEPGEE